MPTTIILSLRIDFNCSIQLFNYYNKIQHQSITINMSSEDVVVYLTEVGSNQRKLEYVRQILSLKHCFMPQSVFRLKAEKSKNIMTRLQFFNLVLEFLPSLSEEQLELIFHYFQIDGKKYIKLDEFTTWFAPKNDCAQQKMLKWRDEDDFKLDNTIKFPLQKFFRQILENQVQLEIYLKFQLEEHPHQHANPTAGKLCNADLRDFFHAHGRHPFDPIIEMIVKEIHYNKGEDKRNKLIAGYVVEFNQYAKKQLGNPPKIIAKFPYSFALNWHERDDSGRNRPHWLDSSRSSKGEPNSPASPFSPNRKKRLGLMHRPSLGIDKKEKDQMNQIKFMNGDRRDVDNNNSFRIQRTNFSFDKQLDSSPLRKRRQQLHRQALHKIEEFKDQNQLIIEPPSFKESSKTTGHNIFAENSSCIGDINAITDKLKKRFNSDDNHGKVKLNSHRIYHLKTPVASKTKISSPYHTVVSKKQITKSLIMRANSRNSSRKYSTSSRKNQQMVPESREKRQKQMIQLYQTPKRLSKSMYRQGFKQK